MSAADPAKIERFRDKLREEWTDQKTVAAWRKWHDRMAEFTREVTAAALEATQLRTGMQVLDLASGVGDPALSIAEVVGPSGHVTATDLGPGMISFAEELAKKKDRHRTLERDAGGILAAVYRSSRALSTADRKAHGGNPSESGG